MKELITPCLWFNNQGKEAASLYCSTLADAQLASQSPMASEITIDGQHVTLLDGGPMYTPNPSISLFYICETEEEFDRAWSAFTEGGKVMMDRGKYSWSEQYGWLTDRFSVSWQLSLGKIKDVGQRLTPCLLFTGDQNGKAEQAINTYTSLFKNSAIDSLKQYGSEQPGAEGKVMHAQVQLAGQKFMFMDGGVQPHQFTFSEGVSLTVHCDTQEEIDYYWEKLTEGGKESMCGWLKDKFGVSWQIIPNILGKLMSDPAKAGKTARAFMQMRKFDIEKLVQATI